MLIVRHGELKGWIAIVCDITFGCKNLSGLATFVELETFGSTKRWIKYEDTVEEWWFFIFFCFQTISSKLMLFDYAHPQNIYFHPLPYPCQIFITAPEPSRPSLPRPPPTPWWETPLRLSTSAWDPSYSTPFGAGMSSMSLEMNTLLSGASVPAPTGPQYALLDEHLNGIKVTATINSKRTTIWGTLVGGERKIVYSVKKVIQIPNPQHVTIVHPGLLYAKGPWVVVRGEHLGMVVSCIGWWREPLGDSDHDVLAQCEVIHRMPGVVGPLEFQSEDLATIASQEKALMSAS